MNISGVIILLSISVILAESAVSIDEADENGILIVEEGSNINLTCRVHGTEGSASEIKWYKSVNGNQVELHEEKYIVNDNTSVLSLQHVSGIGLQHYRCGFDKRHTELIRLIIGIIPRPPNVHCFSRDQQTYWCEYSEDTDTGLRSNFTMEYTTDTFSYPEDADWTQCTEHRNSTNKCYVSGSKFEQNIRVNHTNALGTGSTTVLFYPMRDAIPSPVTSLKVVDATSRTLRISWNKPSEWTFSALKYKITYTAIGRSDSGQIRINKSNRNMVARTLQPLLPYTNYSVEVKSQAYVYDVPEWSVSTIVTGETLEEAPESTVRNLTYTTTTSKTDAYKRNVVVTWKEVPEESRHGIIIGYNVYLESNTEENITARVNDHSYEASGLDKFREYNVSVSAYNNAGEGPSHTIVLPDLTTDPIPPKIVKGFPIARSATSIEVRWEEPENPQGYIEYYLLKWSHNNADWEEQRVNSSQLNYTVTDLEANTEYHFQLGIKNKLGMSELNLNQINQSVKTFAKEKGLEPVILWVSVLGMILIFTSTLFLIYWVRNSEITKPWPEIYIPEIAQNYEITIRYKMKEAEVFDNIHEAPPYDEYVKVREPLPGTDDKVPYQNVDPDFAVGKTGNGLDVGTRQEGESEYKNISTNDADNFGHGNVPQRALLKPLLSHTSSSNSYVNSPKKTLAENKDGVSPDEDVNQQGYSLLSDATSGKMYDTYIPHLGDPKYCDTLGKTDLSVFNG